jgi:hypothetical protein
MRAVERISEFTPTGVSAGVAEKQPSSRPLPPRAKRSCLGGHPEVPGVLKRRTGPAGIPCASESVASACCSRFGCLCSLGAGVDGRRASPTSLLRFGRQNEVSLVVSCDVAYSRSRQGSAGLEALWLRTWDLSDGVACVSPALTSNTPAIAVLCRSVRVPIGFLSGMPIETSSRCERVVPHHF